MIRLSNEDRLHLSACIHAAGLFARSVIAFVILSHATWAGTLPIESSIGLSAVDYLHVSDTAPDAFQHSLISQLVGKANLYIQDSWVEAGFQADGLLVFSNFQNGSVIPYLEFPEAYIGTSRKLAPLSLTFGRRLEHWNQLDEKWKLGIWQPRFRWDYVHPEQVGLTGVFFTAQHSLARLVLMATPVFVPERGVPISVDDGSFPSRSRWFISPPSHVGIFGQRTPIRYSLATPPLQEIVFNPGASAQLRVGGSKGLWASGGYAVKPMNQLLLADDGFASLSANRPIYADVTIYPRVAYHRVASVDVGYESDGLSGWASFLDEQPIRDNTPADWTTQEVRPSQALSAGIDVRVAGTVSRPTLVSLSELLQWGGNAPDQGALAVAGSIFEARYPFQNAVSLGLSTPIWGALSGTTKLIYDVGHDGGIWSTEMKYQTRSNWMFAAGVDLLSSSNPDSSDAVDWVSRYRANDRVHAGVTYVF